jgi:hypothetical protein
MGIILLEQRLGGWRLEGLEAGRLGGSEVGILFLIGSPA